MTPEAEAWIASNKATRLLGEMSLAFDEYLLRLPWLGSALDWSQVGYEHISTNGLTPADFDTWLKKTGVGQHSHAVVWYSAERGGLVVRIEYLTLQSLDELYWHAPGTRFVFGIDAREDRLEPAYGDLLQYGKGDELFAVSSRSGSP